MTSWGSSKSRGDSPHRVFLYEAVTAGGPGCRGTTAKNLASEGRAILTALIQDFSRIPGCQVETLLGDPDSLQSEALSALSMVHLVQPDEHPLVGFDKLAKAADQVLIVAPETDELLLRLTRRAESLGATILCPTSEWVALASDKVRLQTHLASSGIPMSPGRLLGRREQVVDIIEFPSIAKPRWGAGCSENRWIANRADLEALEDRPGWLIEPYHEGIAASVSGVLDGRGFQLLPAGRQEIDLKKSAYLGGEFPLPALLSNRASRLAERVLNALPTNRGWVGIDMVLGQADDGSDDRVIEVNPRVTTSYVGLRAALDLNLAAIVMGAAGQEGLRGSCSPIRFTAEGNVQREQQALR